jgi:sugar phosphate isomerase/epimerase
MVRERQVSQFVNDSGRCSRRIFLGAIAGPALAAQRARLNLASELGITTSSVDAHLASAAGSGSIALMDLPRIVRDELDMSVIDLNTNTIAKLPGERLDAFRRAAHRAGCVLTNLKMNQRGLDMDSLDPTTRTKALTEYKRSIDTAANLGCRWARPLPNAARPDLGVHSSSYRELAEYAAERKVELLVENYG